MCTAKGTVGSNPTLSARSADSSAVAQLSVLVQCRMNSKHIIATLEENPDLSSAERLVWDLEKIKDKIATLGITIN